MADDDPTVAAYVRKVLPEARFQLEIASNGEECLHVLRTQPRGFDLLLLDLMMPEVSGYDVLREMTLTGTAAELPVLVLTNFPEARNGEEQRLLEHGPGARRRAEDRGPRQSRSCSRTSSTGISRVARRRRTPAERRQEAA